MSLLTPSKDHGAESEEPSDSPVRRVDEVRYVCCRSCFCTILTGAVVGIVSTVAKFWDLWDGFLFLFYLFLCFIWLNHEIYICKRPDEFPGQTRFAVMFQGMVGDYGFHLKDVSIPGVTKDHNQFNSVFDIFPGGKAAQLGVQEGWVLEKIGNDVVIHYTADQINKKLANRSWPVELTFVVTATGNRNYVPPDIEYQ